jgi:hypothetical protein
MIPIGTSGGFMHQGLRDRLTPAALTWVVALLLLIGTARAEPSRPTMGPLGERELAVVNHSKHSVVELYISPQSADSWGQDQLGEDVLDPGLTRHVALGRMRDCSFDVLVVYDDTSREENRGVNVCHAHELAFDGAAATAPAAPPGPARGIVVVDASPRPIQQLFLSPPDAAQWGDDRLVSSAISVGEQRNLAFRGPCATDVRVVFANRAAEERRGLDLCANPILRIAPGWTTQDRPDTHD